jgi:iron complex outermembrane recepter protein
MRKVSAALCAGVSVLCIVHPAFAQTGQIIDETPPAGTQLPTSEPEGADIVDDTGELAPSNDTPDEVPASAEVAPRETDAEAEQQVETGVDEQGKEIVVTGTLVRGIAPAGTNVIALSEERVEETGATSTTQLLQTVPQFGSFNTLQTQVGGGNFVTTNRPNLRDLPSSNSTGTAQTLLLVNGHRVVGMGITSTSPDIDIVPPGIIQRLDIVPDGGSALYGSDAIGGVLNFITRKNIDGVELDARYGFADDYWTVDGNATVGKTWTGGSAYATYSFSKHDAIFGRDRDFVVSPATNLPGLTGPGPVISIECSPGNVRPFQSPNLYGLPYTAATSATRRNIVNQCDPSDNATFYPKEHRHSAFAGFQQDLTDNLNFEVNAYYLNRVTRRSDSDFRGTTTIGPAFIGGTSSPFQVQFAIPAEPGLAGGQSVSYRFGPPSGDRQRISLEAWGIDPTINLKVGEWQVRAVVSYGESVTRQRTVDVNPTTLTNAIAAGLFNPYDTSTLSDATYAAITNFNSFGRSDQQLFQGRVIADGELFALPGGGVKLAVGAEYLRQDLQVQKGSTAPGFENSGFPGGPLVPRLNGTLFQLEAPIAALPRFDLNRNVKSVFGELVVPLFGADNRRGGFEELTFSASGRYDDYSDVGTTFNPKFGVTWRPVEWVKLRGSWGKSFAAPSLADSPEGDPSIAGFAGGGIFSFLVPSATVVGAGFPAPTAGQNTLVIIQGTLPGLQPQKATTWTAGIEVEPPFVPGLRLSTTYFNYNYRDLIGQPPFTSFSNYFNNFQSTFIINPTQAQIDAALAQSVSPPGPGCAPQPSCVYIIEDARKTNLGRFKLSGLDFAAYYDRDTSFGSIDASLGGTYQLTRKQSSTATSPFVDDIRNNRSRLKLRGTLGARLGEQFRAQAIWSFSQGFDLSPAIGFPLQDHVDSFHVFDLFFKYDVPGEGLTRDLSFTLNVNNVFDQDPPEFRVQNVVASNNGFTNGSTIGRLVLLGVAKKF